MLGCMLPADFQKRIATVWPAEGQAWLDQLPQQIDALSNRWNLTLFPPFDPLSYNFAAPGVTHTGSPIVLKIGVPRPELTREIDALRFYDGAGICAVLKADPAAGAMVLERLLPGTMLAAEKADERATRIAASVMRSLWRPLPPKARHSFRHVREWAAELDNLYGQFDGGTGPIPKRLGDLAGRLFEELLATAGEEVLIHGDLHHFNILRGRGDAWVAIDPKGMVGERAFETYALLKNPIPSIYSAPNLKHILARRLDILAEELVLPRERVQKWGIAMAVLSSWWGYEDGQAFEGDVHIAQMLADL